MFVLIDMAFTMWRKNNFSTRMLMDTYKDRGGKAINLPQAIALEIMKQMCLICSYQTAITNIHFNYCLDWHTLASNFIEWHCIEILVPLC